MQEPPTAGLVYRSRLLENLLEGVRAGSGFAVGLAVLLVGAAAPVRADPIHAEPAAAAPAHAEPTDHVSLGDEPDPADEPAHEGVPHAPHHKINFGATGSVGGAFITGDRFVAGGGGIFVELPIIHRHLELEVSLHALATEGGVEVSQDVLLKLPIHVNHWFAPFVGLGPSVSEYVIGAEDGGSSHRRGWGIGGTATVGAHFWITNRVGVAVAVDYSLLERWLTDDASHDGSHALVNELGGEVGFIIGL